jgi:hypothetical protein
LNHTAEVNPFGSNYFNWVDAAYCREELCRYPTLVDTTRVIHLFEGFDDEHTTHLTEAGKKEPGFEVMKQQFPTTPSVVQVAEAACRRVKPTEPDVDANPTSSTSDFYPREFPTTPGQIHCTYPRAAHTHPSQTPVRSRRHKLLFEQTSADDSKPFKCAASGEDPRATLGRLLTGGFILGSGTAMRWYAELYARTLDEFTAHGWYYGPDEWIDNYLASVYPNSFITIQAGRPHTCGNPAFFFPQYLQPHWRRACTADQYLPSRVHPVVENC